MMAQTIMNGLIAGSIIGLGAVGITLTYSILRFANFAHGDMISWAAYFALAVSTALGTALPGLATPVGPFSFGWSLPLGLIASIALAGLLTLLVDWLLFGKLRQRGGAVIILVMAGFGAALSLRSFLEFVFSSRPTYFTDALQIALPLSGVRATADQMLGLGIAVVLVALVHAALTRTAAGRAMRAVSENQALAGLDRCGCFTNHPPCLAVWCGPCGSGGCHGGAAGANPAAHGARPAAAAVCSCHSWRHWKCPRGHGCWPDHRPVRGPVRAVCRR